MSSIDDIIRRTAMRTLSILVKDASDEAKEQISSLTSQISSADNLDYKELVEKISLLKKSIKKAQS